MATWTFYNAPPKVCDNISILLSDSVEILGNLTKLCDALDVCVNISFAYTTLVMQVKLFFFQIFIYHLSKQQFLRYIIYIMFTALKQIIDACIINMCHWTMHVPKTLFKAIPLRKKTRLSTYFKL